MSFWEHLDVLRGVIIKILLATVVFSIIAFCFKETLFDIVLAPKNENFVLYRLFHAIEQRVLPSNAISEGFHVELINTGLAQQFMIHMKVAIYTGILIASPYIIYQVFRFVSPALYENERKYAFRVIGSGYLMFIVGALMSYFLIFPLTFRFLGTYQVSSEVENMISINSYIDTFLMMSLTMGIVFEIPVLCWLFARLGFLTSGFMKKHRKHTIVGILVLSAIITPTSDIFTLLLVALPMWLLFEVSIQIVKRQEKQTDTDITENNNIVSSSDI